MPGICLRTTLIAGFPGETRDDVEELKSFLEDSSASTAWASSPIRTKKIPVPTIWKIMYSADEKEARAQEIMEVQQEISYEKNQEKIGQTL
ncbi:MAG: hypothetical protein QM743_09610 [Chitinophagaceae bacterium]